MSEVEHWPVEAVKEAAKHIRGPESVGRNAVASAVRALLDAGYVVVPAEQLAGAVEVLRGVLSGRVVRDETENGDPILLDLATTPATVVRFDRFGHV